MTSRAARIARLRRSIAFRLDPEDAGLAEAAAVELFDEGLERHALVSQVARRRRTYIADAEAAAEAYAREQILADYGSAGRSDWRRRRDAVHFATPFSEVELFIRNAKGGRDDEVVEANVLNDRRARLAWADSESFESEDARARWAYYLSLADREIAERAADRWRRFLDQLRAELPAADWQTFDGYLHRRLADLAAESGLAVSAIHKREQRVLPRVRATWIRQYGDALPSVLTKRPDHRK